MGARGRTRFFVGAAVLAASVTALAPVAGPVAAQPASTGPESLVSSQYAGVSLTLLGSHNLASPGWDGTTKPRGQNGDLAVLDNGNGRTAFVAGGARFHGLWSVTAGRVCTDYGGVKIVNLNNLAAPAGIIDIADTKTVLTGPVGNPRRGLALKNISSSASAVDAMTFTSGPLAGRDILAITTQRCEPSFFNGARVEFWDVTNRSAPTMAGVFDPETILNPNPGNPVNGQWGIFEDIRLFSRNNGPGGSTKHYALTTTPFSIGNAHDASFAGDFRLLDVTNPAVPVQLNTFPNGSVSSVSDNGCRTFHGGRGIAPSPDGSRAILSWYDGIQPGDSALNDDPTKSAAVLNLDLDNIPSVTGTTFPKTMTPKPPVWGYPAGTPGGQTAGGMVEGNAADVQPFNAGGRLLTFVSEDDVDPGLTNFSITAPASVAGGPDQRACQIGVSKHVHLNANQELAGEAVYVGRACPGSQMVNDTLPHDDTLLANPAGKVAIIESGGSNFNQCGAVDKIKRVADAGATAALLNLGGDFLSVHIPGQDGDIPPIPAVGIQLSSYNRMAGLVPNRVLAGTTLPSSYTTTGPSVTVKPFAFAVTAASNATPIAVTTGAHGLVTGDRVTISGVTGNTAANGNFAVTVTSTTAFTLDGSAGNGAFTGGGSGVVCPSSVPNCPFEARRTDFARFRSVASASDRVARGEVATANRFTVSPGQSYTATAHMDVERHVAGAFRTAVVWYDAGGVAIGESQIQSLNSVSPRWQASQTVTAPAGAAKGSVKFEWTGATAEGTAFADSFAVVPNGVQVKIKDHPGECTGAAPTWPPAPCSAANSKSAYGAQRIVDFSAATPTEIGTYRTPRSLQWPPPDDGIYVPSQARMFGNDLAFSAWHSDGLRVLDVSNPAKPRELASFIPPAVADPSAAAGAGPTNRVSGPGTCGGVPVPCMLRGKSFPTHPLVVSVDTIRTGANSGLVVLSDINAGLYVLSFQAQRRAVVDFNKDGASDVSVFRPSSGGWFSNSGLSTVYGASGDIPVPGDYDGDGKADTAIFRPSNGLWSIRNSATNTDTLATYGVGADIPVPGDYDGDGRTDIAILRPSLSTWYLRLSSTGADVITTFGLTGDIPVIGDYDDDGRDDIAVFRNGSWFADPSSGGTFSASFGQSGDIPAAGDYDGDGRADTAVFRPTTGTWFINRSSTNTLTSLVYGVGSDQIQPADYDGDGKTDIGIFRNALSTWFTRNSSNNADVITTFGLSTDVPLPLPNAIRRFFY